MSTASKYLDQTEVLLFQGQGNILAELKFFFYRGPYRITFILTRVMVHFSLYIIIIRGFPGGSDGKESAHNAGDLGLIPGLGRSPGEGYSYPLQYSCLKNPKGQRNLVVHGVGKESDITEAT